MSQNVVHVAAGVITDSDNRILIARRPEHVDQGGLWEFPGGKLEPGEDVLQALQRELREETGIDVKQARPLIRVHFTYPGKQVLLDVWKVNEFSGTAHGREGQPVKWVPVNALGDYRFPAANQPIISAARLPETYLITDEYDSLQTAYSHLQQRLQQGIRLIQFRANYLSQAKYHKWACKLAQLAHDHGAQLLVNCALEQYSTLAADGIHLSSSRLLACNSRPVTKDKWFAASVHNESELLHAMNIDVDFVVLSPVLQTKSHPDAIPLGWQHFRQLTEQASCPVYALGGLSADMLQQAFAHGAQGIAAIRGLA